MVQPAKGTKTKRPGAHLRRDARRGAAREVRVPLPVLLVLVAVVGLGAWSLRSSGAESEAEAVPVTTGAPSTSVAAPVRPPTTTTPLLPAPSVAPLEAGWVALLAEVDRDAGRDALEEALTPMRGVIPSARVLESDDYPSLPPGEWVIVEGPFPDGATAAEYCAGIGTFIGEKCEGRYLSDDGADRLRWCRSDDGRLIGTCDG